jgi:hypothetical protein
MRKVCCDTAPGTIAPSRKAESIQIDMRFEFYLTCSEPAKSIVETGSSCAPIKEAKEISEIAFTGDAPIERSASPKPKVTKFRDNRAKAYELQKPEALRLTGRDSIQDTGEGSWSRLN